MTRTINAVKCLHCGTIIESVHRHDFVTCKCEDEDLRVSVDGGKDYARRVFGHRANYIELKAANNGE